MIEQTMFMIGSVPKTLLAISVGLLIDDFARGQDIVPLQRSLKPFSWDTEMHDLLATDDWALQAIRLEMRHLRVRDALFHVPGLPQCVVLCVVA